MKTYLHLILPVLCSLFLVSCKETEPVEQEPTAATLKIEPSLLNFTSVAATKTVKLTTDASSWSVSEDAEWITVSPDTGNSDTEVTIEVKKNEGSRRSAIVRFSAESAKDVELTVVQDKGETPEEKTGLYSEPEEIDADGPCVLYYKADRTSSVFGQTGDLYAHIGINEWTNVQAEWGVNTEKCRFAKTETANLWKLEITPTVREWFGAESGEVFRICVVVRNADGSLQTEDLFLEVKDTKNAFIPAAVVNESLPADAKHGINYNADGSVTFVLYEKDSKGNRYDWCYLIGEFNDWKLDHGYAMKRDETAGCWWITCDEFESGKEYMFQYMVGNEETRLRLSDPYSEITYSGDDQWISSATYPDLRSYPSETNGYVSAFEIGRNTSYSWTDFKVEDPDDLIIYELLLRDFTLNGGKEGNLALAKEKLDYLETLGVNAIELMPVQEFDGNDSWGYNPNHYFAMDKAYGTREMYKDFINECHKRGFAVIIDVVYNHLTGNNAYDKMYPLDINPFFNEEAPHPYSVFEDIDHENEVIAEYVKRSLGYLLTEYNVDGFRFDLTKGFTNNRSDETTAANYDADRIAILKGYHDYVVGVDPDAIMILEHFCADREEQELAAAGMKVWRNLNNAYCQSAMGYSSESSFSGLLATGNMKFGGYVGFMESHDEERAAYKQKAYGVAEIKNDLAARMQRLELNAAFFLTVPGPKMIWQFGELGYDVSIEEGGRTGKKTPHWEYLEVPERKELYDTYCGLLKFRRDNPEFFDESASFSWKVGSGDWDSGRIITCTAGSRSFVVVGNFSTAAKTITCEMPSSGTWYDYFDRSVTYAGTSLTLDLPAGEFRLLTDF